MAKYGIEAAKEDLERALSHRNVIVSAAAEYHLDAAFVAAIGSRETRWLDKFLLGDIDPVTKKPHGYGYLQIDDRSYPLWTEAYAAGRYSKDDSIRMGAYVISKKHQSLFGPNGKVTFKQIKDQAMIWKAVAAAYNAGEGNVSRLIISSQDVDSRTTGKNYGSDVMERTGFFKENGF